MNIQYQLPENYQKEYIAQNKPQWVTITYPSTLTGTLRKANVLLPYGYSRQKEYPVLYLLHGIGGDEQEWKAGGPEYILANLFSEGKCKECITVFPNERVRVDDTANPADTFSLPHFQSFDCFREELMECLMPYINQHFSVLTGRENTAIGGFSMGGRNTLYIGLTKIEEFGYIGAFSPTFGLLEYENLNIHENGLLSKETFAVKDMYKDSTRLFLINGDHDDVVKNQPQLYHETLLENGSEHLYHIAAGGHDFSVWSVGLYIFAQMLFR